MTLPLQMQPGPGHNLEEGLSIIILVHDSSRTIGRALRSVYHCFEKSARNGPPLKCELILVFDGPDPESAAIVGSITSPPELEVRLIHTEHSGIPSTRNTGIEATRFSHVTFLDSDDEITESRFSQASRWSEDVLCGSQQVTHDLELNANEVPRGQVSGLPHFTSAIIPTRIVRHVGGFDEELALSSDADLLVRIRRAGFRVVFEPEVTVVRHFTGRNASIDSRATRRSLFVSLQKSLDRNKPGGLR